MSIATIEWVRQRFVEERLDQDLVPHRTRRKYGHLMERKKPIYWLWHEANHPRVIGVGACEYWPVKWSGWSTFPEVSHATVRNVMQENELRPWLREEWCIPPEQNADFVYRMEDVLEVYHRPEDVRFPLICFDETPVQLIRETRHPISAKRRLLLGNLENRLS